jgi:hypothetical protein
MNVTKENFNCPFDQDFISINLFENIFLCIIKCNFSEANKNLD